MSSAIRFSFDQSKVLSSGNGLRHRCKSGSYTPIFQRQRTHKIVHELKKLLARESLE